MTPDREKVVKELESLRDICNAKSNMAIGKGKVAWAGYANTADDALVLLKEQETHILTIDHLEDALDTVVWLETPMSENLADGYSLIMAYSHKCGWMLFDSPFGDNPSQDRLEYSEYGKSWRCWNKRPTDEQRQEVKWE